jgi:DAK2 domain
MAYTGQNHKLCIRDTLSEIFSVFGPRYSFSSAELGSIIESLEPKMNTLNLPQVEHILRTIARISHENEKYFCDLDGEMGDADFGKSIWDGFRAVLSELPSIDRSDIGTFLIKVGTIFASHAGGTSGPIWGTAILKAGLKAKGKTELTTTDIVLMGRAAVQGMMARGGAQAGDKTLLDAIVPALGSRNPRREGAPPRQASKCRCRGGRVIRRRLQRPALQQWR